MASIFTRIIKRELPGHIVAEDDHHIAILDIFPVKEGHTLVIPKKEVDDLFDLEPQELASLFVFAQKVARAIEAEIPCRRVGVAVVGLEVPHAHVHLVPINAVTDLDFTNKLSISDKRLGEIQKILSRRYAEIWGS
ncbi:MAG: HIT family protein [Flavobacteriales bacterium]|nr:HIT family protein [Flavobacteriales bacterium]